MSDQPAMQTDHRSRHGQAAEVFDVAGVVSVSAAAASLDLSEGTIRRAIRDGELPATRQGRTLQISLADLDAFRASRGMPQRSEPRLRLVEPVPAATASGAEEQLPVPLFAPERIARVTLPSPLTPFVGRARQLATLHDLLLRDDVRFITLTGPGGVGKTRLALQAAQDVAHAFPGGTIYAPLAALQDPVLIPSAVIQAIGLAESDYLPPAARLEAALRDRRALLLLDNIEHLASDDAGRFVIDLLTSCIGVKLLITSRMRLHLSGEHPFPVPPLALPARDGLRSTPHPGLDLDALGQVESIQLFVDRAQAAWPEFALTPENAPAVTAICDRVDGLPLAIELAAARSAVLSPANLLARLNQRLPLLSGGPQDQPHRLRTMQNAIAWSYDLLDGATQAWFRRLAVFAGGFSLEAAEFVGSAAPPPSPPGAQPAPPERSATPTTLDALATLLTSSLLQRVDFPDGESRFGMLETVREFALDALVAAGEEEAARAAHAACYLAFMRRAEPELWAAGKELLDGIELEHDNLRLALSWTTEHDPETALRLVGPLGAFWSKRAHWIEGRAWLERVLATGAGEGTIDRAVALGRIGAIAGDQGDYDAARRYLDESLALANHLGDAQIAARALRGLGILASNQSDFPRAGELFAAALQCFRVLDDRPGIARCLNDLGLVADRRGDHDGAIAYQEEALPIARAVGDDWQVCIILGNLGGAYYDRGEYARGEALSQESLDLARQIGDTFGMAVNLHNLGNCVFELGDVGGAITRYRECLQLTVELGEQHLASRTLDRLGVALHQTGASRAAARLFGAAAALREAVGDELFAEENANLTGRFQQAREGLGEATFDAAWASGRSLPFAQATAEALDLANTALRAYQSAPARALSGLSVREIDVLRLLVEGRSDKEVASTLFISPRTASSHVAAIIAKLGVDSRTAAVASAIRGGLV